MNRRRLTIALVLLVALAACGGGDEASPAASEVTTTAAATTSPTTQAPPTTAATDGSTTTTALPTLTELRDDLGIAVLGLGPTTETGSHPTLSWQAADGAATYWLVVRDGAGRPYWAWTGSDTSVRIGGGDTPDTNQTAALHEPMTWSVAAFDAAGELIALSDEATVSP